MLSWTNRLASILLTVYHPFLLRFHTADRLLSPFLLQTYSESPGHNFSLNATFSEVDFNKYDGLVIPGGRAPEYLAMDPYVLDLARKFSSAGKPIASVCHGQLILAASDTVRGRKCTAYPAVRPVLVASGAYWVEPETMSSCVTDGNLITGVSYYGHPELIQSFVKALGGNITGSNKRILFLCGVTKSQAWHFLHCNFPLHNHFVILSL